MPTLRAETRPFDLLRIPILGRFLRWRHARTVLQGGMLGLAILLILDGLFGPQIAPRNLAGVLPWVHWRGFVVLALLIAGNLFCMACPFMLPRRLAKRLLPAGRPWPRPLRSKWLAVGLLFVFFWAYEAFSLWQSPWLTAWVAITYFVAAFVIDGFFRGASFCKHVCPIGQFNFMHATVSPLEVGVREPETCSDCATKDCIRGRYAGTSAVPADRPAVSSMGGGGSTSASGIATPPGPLALDSASGTVRLPEVAPPPAMASPSVGSAHDEPAGRGRLVQNGCELWLFQERKVGNVDCTFCMECVHACPHDNVGILARVPGAELWRNPWRSGVGRLTERPDLAGLAVLLTFAAFVNAFGMVRPVQAVLQALGRALGSPPEALILLAFFAGALLLLPLLAMGATSASSRHFSGGQEKLTEIGTRYAYGLVPLGLGMWSAHYLFHLLLGGLTIVPVFHAYLEDLNLAAPGAPAWGMGPMIPETWLFPVQVLLLQGGLAGSLWVLLRIARREHGDTTRAKRAFAPWALLVTVLFATGIWLLLQPMEMRGTFMVDG